jgi:DnaJ-domain-containing protein 1
MLGLAVTMAVQDGRLTVGENLVLQFLADLLGVSPRAFVKLFQQTTHRPFPVAGDPSSVDWWRRREAGGQAETAPDDWGPDRPGDDDDDEPPAAGGPMTRERALVVLGLGRRASADEAHAAYRRLAKVRHPDRFAPLGPAAVATATVAFERLRTAYATVSAAPAQVGL